MTTYITIVLYLIVLFSFHWVFHNKSGATEFTLAGRSLKTLPVLFSILATETSAASLLLFPDLGFNPNHRFIFMQLVAGMIIGRVLAALWLIGPIYNSGKESVYQFLSDLLSPRIADGAALFYTAATVLAAGVRLFIGAIALVILLRGKESFGNLEVAQFIIIAGTIAIYYSRKGGLRGVVYTDNLQFFLIIAALGAILFQTLHSTPAFTFEISQFLKTAPSHQSTWYSETYSLPLALIGGVVLSLGSHGIDQTTIQRVLAQRSAKEAKRSIFYSAIIIGPFIFLYLLAGYLISLQALVPTAESTAYIDKKQYIYPWYLFYKNLPVLLAISSLAFLSAAMSSIDSALHSIATSLKQTNYTLMKKIPLEKLTLYSGLSLILSALFFQVLKTLKPDAMLISLALGATGMIFAPMAAIYLMAIHLSQKALKQLKPSTQKFQTEYPPLTAFIAGLGTNITIFLINHFKPEMNISWLFSLVLSFFLTIGVYYIAVLFGNSFSKAYKEDKKPA